MKEIIAVINQKGGVGKSTTALALGAGLLRKGFKVLRVDLDAQGNLTYTMAADTKEPTALDLLAKRAKLTHVIRHTIQGDVIPSNPALAGADITLTETGKEYRLKEALESIAKDYDYIIIDTPPALGILVINALTASTSAIVPAQADIYSLQGIGQLYQTIDAVRRYCNPNLIVKGILLTRYNARSILSRDLADVIQETAEQFHTEIFKTFIRENIAVKEAQARRQDLFKYAPKSNAALDYASFVDEFLNGREANKNDDTKEEF